MAFFTSARARLVQPYILRRLKTDKSIIADLPDKTEVKAFYHLTRKQAALYQAAVAELEAGLGHVSEVADGDSPHVPGGCPFQAWSLGELIRMRRLLGDAVPPVPA